MHLTNNKDELKWGWNKKTRCVIVKEAYVAMEHSTWKRSNNWWDECLWKLPILKKL